MEIKIIKKDIDYIQISNLFSEIWEGDLDKIIPKTKWAFVDWESCVVLAYEEERLIAVRGGFKWPLSINETSISSFQLHGTCVHKDFRRHGLFTKLTNIFLTELKKNDVKLIFNVSVHASRLGYEKMGWKYLKGFQGLTSICKPLKIKQIIEYRKNITLYNTLNVSNNECIQLDNELFRIREIHFNNLIHTPYNNEFLRWRLSLGGYSILHNEYGAVIYKVEIFNGIKGITIGDYFLYDNKYKYFKKVHGELINQEDPDTINISIFNRHPYFKYFKRKLFLPNPKHINLNFGVKILNESDANILDEKFAFSSLDIDTF